MTKEMRYVNIMGPMIDIDTVIDKYISKYDIQLEYTTKELTDKKGLHSISSVSPYATYINKAETVFKMTDQKLEYTDDISTEEAFETIDFAYNYIEHSTKSLDEIKRKKKEYEDALESIEPFRNLDFNMSDLQDFKFLNYQFGRMPVSSFKQFEKFLYKDNEVIFIEGKQEDEYIWGVYFNIDYLKHKIDSIFSSLHFEKINIPMKLGEKILNGSPEELYQKISAEIKNIDKEIDETERVTMSQAHFDETIAIDENRIGAAYQKIKDVNDSYDTRKYAAKTSNDFFIFVGWMEKDEADKLEKEISKDKSFTFISEEDNEAIKSKAPTKLRNSIFARPFEMFVKMYGLPSYGEMDPTPFVALTYTLLFGIMFGDVGQGVVLSILGIYLEKVKKVALGGVLKIIGISAAFFGVLYGSVFGFEFHGLWISPGESDNMTTFLMLAVVIGVTLILIAIGFNIFNAMRTKEFKKIIFDPNGLTGIIFYAAVIFIAYSVLIGNIAVATPLIIIFIVLPIILMTLREPLTNLITKGRAEISSGVGLFLFEAIVGMFETLLSFFANTVSFIRVGAFALSHASMMGVVIMLSQGAAGTYNPVVIVIGNLIVMGLEGLIVGIQVLRIEFYEMFSRFYKGDGREFVPINVNSNQHKKQA